MLTIQFFTSEMEHSISSNDTVSSRKLKRSLYQSLHEKGVVQELKSNLRHKLIAELCPISFNQSTKTIINNNDNSSQIINSIVVDYLQKYNHSYTLSVFMPEAGIQNTCIYSEEVILKLLKLDGYLSKYQMELPLKRNSKTCLLEIMIKLIGTIFSRATHDVCIQAGSDFGVAFYENQLRKIDQQFESKHLFDVEATRTAFEEKLTIFRQEIEYELQQEYSKKFDHFKQSELTKLKDIAKHEFTQKLDEKQSQLEELFVAQRLTLEEREHHLAEMSEKAREVNDRTGFLQRQVLEAEIEAARVQKEKAGQLEWECERQRKLMHQEEQKCRLKLDSEERKLLAMKQAFEEQVQEEVDRLRKTDELNLLRRKKDLEVSEARLLVEQNALQAQKKAVQSAQDEAELNAALYSEMEVADYKILKKKLSSSMNEIKLLKQRLGQAMEEIEQLKEVAVKTAGEKQVLLSCRNEVERLRVALEQERTTANTERIRMQLKIDQLTSENSRFSERVCLQENELSRLRIYLAEMRSTRMPSSSVFHKNTNLHADQPREPEAPSHRPEVQCSVSTPLVISQQSIASDARERLLNLEQQSTELEQAYMKWRESSFANKPSTQTTACAMTTGGEKKATTIKSGLISRSLSSAFFTNLKSNPAAMGLRPFTNQWTLPYMRSMNSVVDAAHEAWVKPALIRGSSESNLGHGFNSQMMATCGTKLEDFDKQLGGNLPKSASIENLGVTETAQETALQATILQKVGPESVRTTNPLQLAEDIMKTQDKHSVDGEIQYKGQTPPFVGSNANIISPSLSTTAMTVEEQCQELSSQVLQDDNVSDKEDAKIATPAEMKIQLLCGGDSQLAIDHSKLISGNIISGPETSDSEFESNEDEDSRLLHSSENDVAPETHKNGSEASSSDAGIDPMMRKYMKILENQQKNMKTMDNGSFSIPKVIKEQPTNEPSFGNFLNNNQFDSDGTGSGSKPTKRIAALKSEDEKSDHRDNSDEFW